MLSDETIRAALPHTLESIELPFPRYRYAEILDMLRKKGMDLPWGADLGYTEEKVLTEDLTTPIFITHFPKEKHFFLKIYVSMRARKQIPRNLSMRFTIRSIQVSM